MERAAALKSHSALQSAVWSPRVALVLKPTADQNVRLTYNRAFSTPTNNNLFLDIKAGTAGPYNVFAVGVPEGGFHFRASGGCSGGLGSLCMRSPFVPQSPLMPAQAALLWPAAVAIMVANPNVPAQVKPLLQATPAPTTQVQTQLRALNVTTQTFLDVGPEQVRDIEQLKPTITNTLEAGYKANLGGKLRLSVDGWYEQRKNFVGPLIVESPNVFLDRSSLIAYLTQVWTAIGVPNAAQTAAQIGTAMAGVSGSATVTGIPLGTVVPNDSRTEVLPLLRRTFGAFARPDIFLTYRNFGKVDLWGSDLAVDYLITPELSLAATYSWVNHDFFSKQDLGGLSDVALNASKSRASGSVRYRSDTKGWGAEVHFRYLKGFPVNSGVYVSPQRSDGSYIPTDSYGVFDVQGSWRPPLGTRNMLVSATLTNVLNHGYATFVGVPKLGRMLLTKVSYTF